MRKADGGLDAGPSRSMRPPSILIRVGEFGRWIVLRVRAKGGRMEFEMISVVASVVAAVLAGCAVVLSVRARKERAAREEEVARTAEEALAYT